MVRADGDWLALREPADAAARSGDLAGLLRRRLAASGPLLVHDLGSGTGSMARWLAPHLPGPQRWVLHDRDADLLDRVATCPMPLAADGTPVDVDVRHDDVTRLDPAALRGAELLTASALLDMMSAPELSRFVAGCVRPACPVLITLSVVGHVELTPPDVLDRVVTDAFNAHQRRTTGTRTLLGPDAVAVAAGLFGRHGFHVTTRPSPWRLGRDRGELAAGWFTEWVDAAVEQRPGLADPVAPYARRRLAQAATGALAVTVHHADLLAVPPGSAPRGGQ